MTGVRGVFVSVGTPPAMADSRGIRPEAVAALPLVHSAAAAETGAGSRGRVAARRTSWRGGILHGGQLFAGALSGGCGHAAICGGLPKWPRVLERRAARPRRLGARMLPPNAAHACPIAFRPFMMRTAVVDGSGWCCCAVCCRVAIAGLCSGALNALDDTLAMYAGVKGATCAVVCRRAPSWTCKITARMVTVGMVALGHAVA